jgi:hypothetical protein
MEGRTACIMQNKRVKLSGSLLLIQKLNTELYKTNYGILYNILLMFPSVPNNKIIKP